MLDTLVKFPSKSRPILFADTFRKWFADESVKFVITLNSDDPTLGAYLREIALYDQSRIKIRVTDVKTKIEAMNDGVAEEDFQFVLGAQDDMTPTRPDYAARIREIFKQHFPQGDGVLWLYDGRQKQLNTSLCMDRKFFDRFGTLYHRAYTSLWADNELHEVASILGKQVFIEELILKHEWIGDGPHADDLFVRNELPYSDDMEIFKQRQAAGFPK
jgi:hypothetical protein